MERIFAIDGILHTLKTAWMVAQPYTTRNLTFKGVTPGKYRLTIRWYDINAPDLRALTTVDSANNITADAVLVPEFTVAG